MPDLPAPRPKFEIWVYSPRVEGVHLRFGPVARGGLRWSDRREDFRTEVLGLVKAQMVKNAVIVPVGAKGGFVVKRPPADPTDREAVLAEGIACYRTFISGLLDVTDNLVAVDGEQEVVPPPQVVRHDGDDTYLVVAADKGTATFSDIANQVSLDYGFWLGDAFASGGSVGYDHKAMGITARGAWESVKRHFRELGIDTQTEDFTVVGIGDMSGDVFGNGMLLSEHIRLVAAFDHRHVFLDPDPDAATSYAERRRLFDLPRSSWADYDRSLISAGGGVYPRTAKSIPISHAGPGAPRAAGGRPVADPGRADAGRRSPPRSTCCGTAASAPTSRRGTESHADVGDKANDAIRVDGADLRVQGRRRGRQPRPHPAGPDRVRPRAAGASTPTRSTTAPASTPPTTRSTSRSCWTRPCATARSPPSDRNPLLAEMTDDGRRAWCCATTTSRTCCSATPGSRRRRCSRCTAGFISSLEARGELDRELEFLPTKAEIAQRRGRRAGPDLAASWRCWRRTPRSP